MAGNSFNSGQSLASTGIHIYGRGETGTYSWGPDTQIFVRATVHAGLYGVRLEAVKWTGTGNIVVKDGHGIELFSGATAGEPVRVHSVLPHITTVAPLTITVTSGSTGSVFLYGIVL